MYKYLSGFLKYFFYKRVSFLTLIDGTTKIHSTARIYSGCRLINSRIDAFSYISYKSTLVNVTVGKFCSIASGVYIGLDAHNLNGVSTSPIFYTPHNALDISWVNNSFFDDSHKEVIIGNDVWIGTKVVIKGGITIGDGAVIGACAVVTKDVPPYSICAGIPAKIIRYRFSPEDIQLLQKEEWWNLSPNLLKENAMHFNSGDISFLRDLCR